MPRILYSDLIVDNFGIIYYNRRADMSVLEHKVFFEYKATPTATARGLWLATYWQLYTYLDGKQFNLADVNIDYSATKSLALNKKLAEEVLIRNSSVPITLALPTIMPKSNNFTDVVKKRLAAIEKGAPLLDGNELYELTHGRLEAEVPWEFWYITGHILLS